ncbi:hypothetical protein EG328_005283 [Venturia inaequalis]|uniref:Uncharacterized protein n=1 Tax=Venturia inaequalis TaxID=5025 RepID=A0A8H3YU19_VENIN|nr:hypothetical protein EG328_005283 [Venturia inaequalis]KAE9990889.1 hypothetical protein EG327_000770 [Venturia inaequalis]
MSNTVSARTRSKTNCAQSTTNHKKRKSAKEGLSVHKEIHYSPISADASSLTSPTRKMHVSRLPFSKCFYILPAEIQNQIDLEIFRLKFNRNPAVPVPTDPDSDFIKDLETFQNLPDYRQIFALHGGNNTFRVTMDRSSPHPIPAFLTNPTFAPSINHLTIPQLLDKAQNSTHSFPLAVIKALTGLKTISLSAIIKIDGSDDPSHRHHNNNATPWPIPAETIGRLPLLFYSEFLVKKPEIEVMLLAYYHYSSLPKKHVRPRPHVAVKYRLLAQGATAALQRCQVFGEGDVLWERGLPEYTRDDDM